MNKQPEEILCNILPVLVVTLSFQACSITDLNILIPKTIKTLDICSCEDVSHFPTSASNIAWSILSLINSINLLDILGIIPVAFLLKKIT